MMMWVAALLVLLSAGSAVEASCINASDVGSTECFRYTDYSEPQWSTCVTNQYMQIITKDEYECLNQTVPYCRIPCQLEEYGKVSGNVSSDCLCSRYTALTLNRACYSPSGDDCNWYSDCLEEQISCTGGRDGYATEYAQTFCNKFHDTIPNLSAQGQTWMSAARKCLQVTLVSLLRPFALANCTSVKDRAFRSHPDCYLRPSLNAPSMCDLPCGDWWTVFWTIKDALPSNPIETVAGMIKVGKQCRGWKKLCFTNSTEELGTKLLNISMQLPLRLVVAGNGSVRPEVEIDTIAMSAQELEYSRFSKQLAQGMATKLGWVEEGLIWFAFGESTDNNTVITVHVLLADRSSYGLSQTSGQLTPNLTLVIEKAATAFQSGALNDVKVDNYYVQLLTLSTCEDGDCQQPALNATAPANANFDAYANPHNIGTTAKPSNSGTTATPGNNGNTANPGNSGNTATPSKSGNTANPGNSGRSSGVLSQSSLKTVAYFLSLFVIIVR